MDKCVTLKAKYFIPILIVLLIIPLVSVSADALSTPSFKTGVRLKTSNTVFTLGSDFQFDKVKTDSSNLYIYESISGLGITDFRLSSSDSAQFIINSWFTDIYSSAEVVLTSPTSTNVHLNLYSSQMVSASAIGCISQSYNISTKILSMVINTDVNSIIEISALIHDPILDATNKSGYIYQGGSSYSTTWAYSYGTVQVNYVDGTRVGQYYDYQSWIYRSYFFFNTSSIPSGGVITSASFNIYVMGKYVSGSDFDVVIQKGDSGYPHSDLQTFDFDQSKYSGNFGSLTVSSMTANSFNNITVSNPDNLIVGQGTTSLCLRSSRDINQNSPGGAEWLKIGTVASGHPAQLIVAYQISEEETVFLTIEESDFGSCNETVGEHEEVTGSYVNVLFTPLNDTSYFKYWLLNGENVGSNNPISVYMAANETLTPIGGTWFYLTILPYTGNGGLGETDPTDGTYEYHYNTVHQILATPENASYYVYGWWLDIVTHVYGNPYSINMNSNHTLQAIIDYVGDSLILMYDPTVNNGYTNPSGGSATYQTLNTFLTLSAYPNQGYTFSGWNFLATRQGWSHDLIITSNPYTFKLTNDTYEITPIYTLNSYTVSFESLIGDGTGHINNFIGDNYNFGDVHAFDYGSSAGALRYIYVSDSGLGFNHWLVNGISVYSETLVLPTDKNYIVIVVLNSPIPEEGEPDFWFSFSTALIPVISLTGIMGFVGNVLTSRFSDTRWGWVGGGEVGLFICAYSGLMDAIYFLLSFFILSVTVYLWWKRG